MRTVKGKSWPWVFLPVVLAGVAAVLILGRSSGKQLDARADRVVVDKSQHTLTLLSQGHVLKTYRVALGRGGLGQKVREGDNKVPEGLYRIASHNPHSAFHLALRVGYPTPEQVRAADAAGINPGDDIMVHGIRNGLGWLGSLQKYVDWTKGCIAVTDAEIEEIGRAVPDGTLIEIRPQLPYVRKVVSDKWPLAFASLNA